MEPEKLALFVYLCIISPAAFIAIVYFLGRRKR